MWKGVRKMSYLKFENIVREYKTGDVTIRALDNTNFEIEKVN